MNIQKALEAATDTLVSLRGVLNAAGYNPDGILRTIGVTDSVSIRESDILLLMHRTAGGTPLETLIRLFLIETPVELSQLGKAIEPMGVSEWLEMGLISVAGGSARAEMKLFPYGDMVMVYDVPRRLLTDQGYDFVMGIGGSSITLANFTVRKEVESALDLGTGCGFQAFLAAGHSGRVIAVDRNPRAVALAKLNARLNGIKNIECREGDLFAPVGGMTFDLIVSNPPFVISPESRYIYRDSPMEGDGVSRRIVREAPDFLNEGGICQILCNWAEFADRDWRDSLKEWAEGCGCDVWVMRNQSRDVANYAANWIRHTEKLDTDNMEERFADWLGYYEKKGIERVGGGLINMRRRSGAGNWFYAEDGVEKTFGPGGDYILKGFTARDFLDRFRDDSQLLQVSFRISPDARLINQKLPADDGWEMEVSEIHLSRGLSQKGRIDRFVESMLVRCNGARPLHSLVTEMAESIGVETNTIESAVCTLVRSFVERGFLLPPS